MLKPVSEMPDDQRFLVSTVSPSREQTRLAVWVLLVLLLALIITMPFARVPLNNTEVLLPAYATAVLMSELITSALLLVLFSIYVPARYWFSRSGTCYRPDDSLLGAYVSRSVRAFRPARRRAAGYRHDRGAPAHGLPAFVLAYAVLKDAGPVVGTMRGPVHTVILGSIAAVVAGVCGLTWFSVADGALLPNLMADNSRVSDVWRYVPASASVLCLAALTLLWSRRRSVLDLWLMVVLCVWLIETFLLGYLSAGRFSVGWWAGRVYGLMSASAVLLVLLSETTALYARLAHSVSAERRIREARLTTMEVLSASIAHEVNHRWRVMVTHANAGLRWLERKSPDLDEAKAALKSIVNDGHRAAKIIESVRVVFRKGTQDRVPLNINELIQEVLRHAQSEVRINRIYIQDPTGWNNLPLVTGNPVSLAKSC